MKILLVRASSKTKIIVKYLIRNANKAHIYLETIRWFYSKLFQIPVNFIFSQKTIS